MSCQGCTEKTINRELEDLLVKAKQQAIEDKKPKAVCADQITGLFIADAATAFREHFNIKSVVSGLQ